MKTNPKIIYSLLEKIEENYFSEHPKENILHQLTNLLSGSNYVELIKPATIGDGIIKIDESQEKILLENFDAARLSGRFTKFVPASGAATRMFARLHSAIIKYSQINLKNLIEFAKSDQEADYLINLISNLKRFSFYDELISLTNLTDSEFEKSLSENPTEILNLIISSKGLDYQNKPKALIKFHKYDAQARTAFIEHLYESSYYQADMNNSLTIHFTISEVHKQLFEQEEKQIYNYSSLKDYNFDITYSYQKKSTDSITLTIENKLFSENGKPLFRPAGHGALLENLNDLNADIVFIKNIDNVCVDRLKPVTVKYKKLLAGFCILIQKLVFEYLLMLEKKEDDQVKRNEIISFAEKLLNIQKPNGYINWNSEKQREFLFNKLNRPIRVCGVVKNQGEPGGAPFWIKDENGGTSIQIVEKAQIDLHDEKQNLIFNNSTHFNPVDIVAALRDFKGKKFNLLNFRDDSSYMIVHKTVGTTKIKSLELPGLWNGGMSDWISVFVEVPIETFNPVKEITDLLKEGHIEKTNRE